METTTAIQEIVLNTDSTFCKRECANQKDSQEPQSMTAVLKNLCWDGKIPQLLPEICIKHNNRPLILWEMMGLTTILHLKMGGPDERLDPEYALHPYLIIDMTILN